jgi:hypothetical protein
MTHQSLAATLTALMMVTSCTSSSPSAPSAKTSRPISMPTDLPEICSGLVSPEQLWSLIGDYRTLAQLNEFEFLDTGYASCSLSDSSGIVFELTAEYDDTGETFNRIAGIKKQLRDSQQASGAVAASRSDSVNAMINTPFSVYLQLRVNARGSSPAEVAKALAAITETARRYKEKQLAPARK